MASLKIQKRLALNSRCVPMTEAQMLMADPLNLQGSLPSAFDDTKLYNCNIVSFGTAAKMAWFLKVLKLKQQWWRKHAHKIQLIQDICKVLRNTKEKFKGNAARLPREPQAVMIMKVRERLIFVINRGPKKSLVLIDAF